MKKLFALILFTLLYYTGYSQFTVRGLIIDTNGDTVENQTVYIYPDTSSGPLTFTPRIATTDTMGFAVFISDTIPVNSPIKVSTFNCNGVLLTNNHIYTGATSISSNFNVCIVTPDTVKGYVHLGSPAKRPQPQQAMVYLISRCASNLVTYKDSILTDTNGFFKLDSFPKFDPGCGLIMSARLLPSSPDYNKYLPAYHNGDTAYQLRWYESKYIPQLVALGGVNILLPEAINPTGGPSKIAGYAIDAVAGGTAPNRILKMTDMNDVTVAYTYTDVNGRFMFSNLPFGTYKIFGDVWGKDNPELVVTVNADHVDEYEIIFSDKSNEFSGRIATSVGRIDKSLAVLNIYPNPVQNMLYVNGAEKLDGEKTLILTSITGKQISKTSFSDGQKPFIDCSYLPAGLYLLNVNTEIGSASFRVIVK